VTEWDWLRIVWLATVLGLALATVRTQQIGGRKMLVMVLAWICIFMAAAGLASFIEDLDAGQEIAPPAFDDEPNLT
jgi:hypothetical protein